MEERRRVQGILCDPHRLQGSRHDPQSILLPGGLGTCHIGQGLRVFARWKNRLNVLNVFSVYSVWHLKSVSSQFGLFNIHPIQSEPLY